MIKKLAIPEGVELKVEGKKVIVKGQKGELSKNFSNPVFNKLLSIRQENSELVIESKSERRKVKSMVGTVYSIVSNMIRGVTKGYSYALKIYFVHFPITVDAKETEKGVEVSVKNFLGEKKPRKATLRDVKVEVKADMITVSGADKEKVGQASARLEQITKVRRKDRRIFNDGIFLIKKYERRGEDA